MWPTSLPGLQPGDRGGGEGDGEGDGILVLMLLLLPAAGPVSIGQSVRRPVAL